MKGNSVRFRLTKTEVETFCKTGYFEEQVHFLESTFIYALELSGTAQNMVAQFRQSKTIVSIPKDLVGNWDANETVGFNSKIPLKNGEELSILIEKDFVCMDETVEDQSDNYPNPLAMKT